MVVLRKKQIRPHLNPGFFMQRLSERCIRDVAHRGWVSLPLGNPSECNGVVVEVPPSANSPVFRVRGWSVDVEDCTTGEFNTHKTDVSVVRYPWHPWFGRQVTIQWVRRRAGITILGCTADNESDRPILEIPQWMCESGACTGLCVETNARVDCGTLRTLKLLLERVVRVQQESALGVQHHSTFGGAGCWIYL